MRNDPRTSDAELDSREPASSRRDPETLVRTCPNCSAGLVESRCKLLCPRCHYYMSCSDYY